jgi:hypothetical protein
VGKVRRSWSALGAFTALVIAGAGVTAAVAQTEPEQDGSPPAELLERLDELEDDLPEAAPPQDVLLDEETTWGSLDGDPTGVRAVLDTLEPDLRALYVDADDADGDVPEAVADVARGWLDLWNGTTSLAAADTHDLAFPEEATDELGVATGADELRGSVEIGLELIVEGQQRLLAGYTQLRELDEAEPEAQERFEQRADAAEFYEAEVLPRIVVMLSQPTSTVLVPVDRFETDAPGVQSRASALGVICVDRAELEALGGVATPEVLAQLEPVERVDCPNLPAPLDDLDVAPDAFVDPEEELDPDELFDEGFEDDLADELEQELEDELQQELDDTLDDPAEEEPEDEPEDELEDDLDDDLEDLEDLDGELDEELTDQL